MAPEGAPSPRRRPCLPLRLALHPGTQPQTPGLGLGSKLGSGSGGSGGACCASHAKIARDVPPTVEPPASALPARQPTSQPPPPPWASFPSLPRPPIAEVPLRTSVQFCCSPRHGDLGRLCNRPVTGSLLSRTSTRRGASGRRASPVQRERAPPRWAHTTLELAESHGQQRSSLWKRVAKRIMFPLSAVGQALPQC